MADSNHINVQEVYDKAILEYSRITSNKFYYLSPTSISSILKCLQKLKCGLDLIFELPERKQEELAWLVLNICKLILEAGEPLTWFGCGKYVVEYLVFAATCLDSLVNLATTRHLGINTKLYTSAILALLSQDCIDEANSLLFRFTNQIKDLRKREEIDPPVPDHIEEKLVQVELDIAVMKCVYQFYKDPEQKLVNDPQHYGGPKWPTAVKDEKSSYNSQTFLELCFQECVRLHQMSAGNSNDARMRRATSLLKCFTAFLEPVPAPAGAAPTAPHAAPTKGGKATKPDKVDKSHSDATAGHESMHVKFTNQIILDVVTIAMFDKIDSHFSVSDLLERLWPMITKNMDDSNAHGTIPYDMESLNKELNLLKQLRQYLTAKDKQKLLAEAVEFMRQIHSFMHGEFAFRRRSLLRRMVMAVWSNCIYPSLQTLLSTEDTGYSLSSEDFEAVCPPLQTVIHTLDIVGADDLIFLSSVALVTANILRLFNEKRSAISVLYRTVNVLDEHRSSRVDVHLHMPGEAEDLLALQHSSFSTKVSAEDWYHSQNRLGAHMFAGFSIFGAGSTADRMDQAFAEIQAELLTLYFRTEIEYGIEQRVLKLKHRRMLQLREQRRLAAAVSTGPSATAGGGAAAGGHSTSTKSRTPVVTKGTTAAPGSTDESDIVIDKLPCVTCLKAYCCKAGYARCLLLLEIVRAETSEERKLMHMKAAQEAIEEVTEKEESLRNAFKDLSLTTDDALHYPIVLSRSHRCIFVSPVMCTKKHRKAHYFRILAREEASGISLTLGSNTLPGCEVKILASEMKSPAMCAVPITSLRRGERYLFAVVAYTVEDVIIGEISPSTPLVIDAVNPLPVALLWTYFTQVAQEMNFIKSVKYGATNVLSQFFQDPSIPPPRVFGKGINLFFTQEPTLCMLTIHQSSEILLSGLVRSFLYFEIPANPNHIYNVPIHWHIRKSKQIDTILRVRKTAVMTSVACQINNAELIIRCAALGYELASDVLKYDETHLAPYLQQPLLIFAAALQTIPLKYWKDIEHTLYNVLMYHVCRCAVITANTNTVNMVLTTFHSDLPKDVPTVPIFSEKLQSMYLSLIPSLRLINNIMSTPPLEAQVQCILGVNHDIKTKLNIWGLSSAQRLHILKGVGLALAGVPGATSVPTHINEALKEEAPLISAHLEVLVHLVREVVDSGHPSLASKILVLLPVYEGSLAPPVKQACHDWGLDFILKGSRPVVVVTTNAKETKEAKGAKNAKDAKGGKNAHAQPPPEVVEAAVEPSVQVVVFTEEECRGQLFLLASLTSFLSTACFENFGKTNNYPVDEAGPKFTFNPTVMREEMVKELALTPTSIPETPAVASEHIASSGSKSPSKNVQATAQAPSPTAQQLQLKPKDFVTYCMACLSMFLQSETPNAAVSSVTTLWTHIIDEWYTPKMFANTVRDVNRHVIVGMEAYLSLLEILRDVYVILLADAAKDSPKNIDLTSRFPCTVMDIKEFLYVSKDFLPYMIQTIWYLDEQKSVVDYGTRVIILFMHVAPEYSKSVGEICLPLIIEAQEQISLEAEKVLAKRKEELETFIAEWEEAQRKIRRKKLRIARIEKSEEELKFEADKAALEERSYRAQSGLQLCNDRITTILQLEKDFGNIWSTGMQMLGKVREVVKELLSLCKAHLDTISNNASVGVKDYALCLESLTISEKLADAMDMFGQLAQLLRDRREYDTLLETLKDQGDLLVLFGRQREAHSVWNDAIDGLFSVMDAAMNWKTVTEDALRKLDTHIVHGAIPAMIILGKLSKYCCSRDWDLKSQYCRMAAELCRIPFVGSIGHPQTTYGFAAYVCRALGGTSPLVLSEEKMTAYSLQIACEEILSVLLAEKYCIEALPVVVLFEYFHAVYTQRSDEWLRARILRIRILIETSLFAEAASMLAGIAEAIASIEDRTYSRPTSLPVSLLPKFKHTADFDGVESGLLFRHVAPYFNHLPPHDDKNKLALEWVKVYPKTFKDFAAHYNIALPVVDKPAAAAEPVAVAADPKKPAGKDKKGKGSTADGNSAVSSSHSDVGVRTVPKFPPLLEYLVVEACALFLMSISETTTRLLIPYHAYLVSLAASADDMLTSAITGIESITTTNHSLADDVTRDSALAICLLHRCKLLRCRTLPIMQDNNLKPVLAALEALSIALKNIPKPVTATILSELTQVWFQTRERVVIASQRFGRLQTVISLSSQTLTDAISCCAGFWVRRLLLHRAQAHFKLGNKDECLSDCDTVIQNYESVGTIDVEFVRTLVLKASLLRQNAIKIRGLECLTALQSCLALLRRARDIACDISHRHGFFGVDANLTFTREDSMVLSHTARPPLLHHLSTEHDNYPPLSIPPKIASSEIKSKNNAMPKIAESVETDLSNNFKYTSREIEAFRLGPVDKEGEYVKCEYVNIYLKSVRTLVNCYSALCMVLDDIRIANSTDNDLVPEGDGSDRISEGTDKHQFSRVENVLCEESVCSEEGLKALRHCLYACPYTHISLLTFAGKTRIAMAAKGAKGDNLVAPLQMALDMSVNGVHPWETMSLLCLELLECYGNTKLQLPEKNELRLHIAISYLQIAVKLNMQLDMVRANILTLCSQDRVLAGPCVAELSTLMNGYIGNDAVKATYSGVKSATAITPASDSIVSTGRDALFLLSSLMRESDVLWLDGFEFATRADLQLALKKNSAIFTSFCWLPSTIIPSSKSGPPNVPPNSICALWVSTTSLKAKQIETTESDTDGPESSTTGLFDCVTGYFLCGSPLVVVEDPKARKQNHASTASSPPTAEALLRKRTILRNELVYINRKAGRIAESFNVYGGHATADQLKSLGEEMRELLTRVHASLAHEGGGAIHSSSELKLQSDVILESGSFMLKISIPRPSSSSEHLSCMVPVSAVTVTHLMEVFAPDKACESLVDNPLCVFLRMVWGYQ